MKVCITEKPSVAKDIAAILGAKARHDGYFEGNGYQITWTFGHLCTLKEPSQYNPVWKYWSLGQLPMIPERFSISLIKDKGIEHQFAVIERLVSEADIVINCGDAGQEGELIQRWVLQKAKVKCPVKRLWISSLTDDAIREGFADLKPESDFDSLYHSGLSRAIGDWVLGLNATRLYTLKFSTPGNTLSVGRVQTPTLALIVKRAREIREFVPENFWELKTEYREVTFSATGVKFESEEKANAAVDLIKDLPFTICDINRKQGKEAPPRLFDLTSLQVECNKKWGWSADQTLKLIQSLYEKKVITYPRVDTTYLTADLYAKIPGILQKMSPYDKFTAKLLDSPLPKSKRIFDNAKVTDHHAIIPTGVSQTALEGDEKLLYHLIALRFIAAFYPDCVFLQTTITGKAGDIQFKVTGKQIETPGWQELYPAKQTAKTDETKDNGEDQDRILPSFEQGESGRHNPSVIKKTTQPPKPYTEGTLLRAMETAGRTVDDETLREALKENGIGRPSTRAAIIETLFKRRYIERQKKAIIPTEAGEALIDLIDEPILKSAKLTGIWESKLRKIEKKEYSASAFIEELKEMISKIVIDVMSKNDNGKITFAQNGTQPVKAAKTKSATAKTNNTEKKKSYIRTTKFEQIQCPKCKKGHLLKGKTAFGCSGYREGCDFRISFTEIPENTTPSQLKKKLS